jgi:tRNA(Met) cytidine acetyltransferase
MTIPNHTLISRQQLKPWLVQRAGLPSHRQLLVINDKLANCIQYVIDILAETQAREVIWLGDQAPEGILTYPQKHYQKALGMEYQVAIINCHHGLSPNALLAIAGTVKSKGIMVILCPQFSLWPQQIYASAGNKLSFASDDNNSLFCQHLIKHIHGNTSVGILSSHTGIRLPLSTHDEPIVTSTPPFKSRDQYLAYHQLITHWQTSTSPVCITADRGRGKSTLLGLVAIALLRRSNTRIAICCHNQDSIKRIFTTISDYGAENNYIGPTHVQSPSQSLVKWYAIDAPELTPGNFDYILIDEAAALPVDKLRALVNVGNRVLISTTTKGYEGSGRGFSTRFLPWLKTSYPNLVTLKLTTPIRWYPNDSLEIFWQDALFLDSDDDLSPPVEGKPSEDIEYKISTFNALMEENSFSHIIKLLSYAHYQTSPNDIMRLLDSNQTFCLGAWDKSKLLGVAIIHQEGGHSLQPYEQEIATGKRRLQGHLSAQSIALSLADGKLATAIYWRISRIVVEETYRHLGIGSHLLRKVAQLAKQKNIDALTTSFGCNKELVNFWQKNAFIPLRLGLKKDTSSGEYSLLMLLPLSAKLTTYISLIHTIFSLETRCHPEANDLTLGFDSLAHSLTPAYSSLCNKILTQVHKGVRSPLHARGAFYYWLSQNTTDSQLTTQELSLIKSFVGNKTLTCLAQESGLSGKKALLTYLTGLTGKLLN